MEALFDSDYSGEDGASIFFFRYASTLFDTKENKDTTNGFTIVYDHFTRIPQRHIPRSAMLSFSCFSALKSKKQLTLSFLFFLFFCIHEIRSHS